MKTFGAGATTTNDYTQVQDCQKRESKVKHVLASKTWWEKLRSRGRLVGQEEEYIWRQHRKG